MKITSDLFAAYLKCPTKCWLRAHDEAGEGNEYADWVRTQNESYRRANVPRLWESFPENERATSPMMVEKLDGPSVGDPNGRDGPPGRPRSPTATARPPDALHLKSAKWRLAVDLPAQTQDLESRLHAVERLPSEGRGKPAQFIPIRFVFTNKLTKDDKLLAAFDALVLSEMLGRDVSLGKIIHGDGHATLKVKSAAQAKEVRKRAEKITALLSSQSPPDLVLNRHCAECEFQARCRKIAVEKDDLSLLAGMSAKERQKLRSKGIFTVTQLSYTFRPRRRPKRLRDKREKYHHSLKALAIREKKIHIVGSPELKIDGTPVYLDVEGLPDRDFYYLIGLRIGHGESAIQRSLWADTIADEGKIWREFLAILETVEKPALIHYGSYETNFLKQMKDRHGSPLEGSISAQAIDSALNLISVMFAKIYFPTFSNGLKDIAGGLGFKWSEIQASGSRSVMWRHAWNGSKDSAIKSKLVTYNAEDCEALALVERAVSRLTGHTALPDDIGKQGIGVVRTDDLKQPIVSPTSRIRGVWSRKFLKIKPRFSKVCTTTSAREPQLQRS